MIRPRQNLPCGRNRHLGVYLPIDSIGRADHPRLIDTPVSGWYVVCLLLLHYDSKNIMNTEDEKNQQSVLTEWCRLLALLCLTMKELKMKNYLFDFGGSAWQKNKFRDSILSR